MWDAANSLLVLSGFVASLTIAKKFLSSSGENLCKRAFLNFTFSVNKRRGKGGAIT